ncbi:response regulator [Pararhodospirillum photometricum]|uniref:Response regulatory domain-containing protein n=1 Tax=Pararhodospirillum photometricum DSM 122 TaxID=1150469 RepID=H6SRT3_PARPM|nr:response regulator [Pararhodospirillum photometricum]CCG07612.1 unnamed protein product [Pararhodospirillum photometricum DSM 122]
MRILVVDDDPLAGELVGAVLEDAGHDIVLAGNAMEALDALEAPDGKIPDLIISDMHMPVVSGIDLFRTLRDQNLDIPFLLLTGDDPAGLWAEEPRLTGCLMKDAALEDVLPQAVADLPNR